jgi:hypothetical protein
LVPSNQTQVEGVDGMPINIQAYSIISRADTPATLDGAWGNYVVCLSKRQLGLQPLVQHLARGSKNIVVAPKRKATPARHTMDPSGPQ